MKLKRPVSWLGPSACHSPFVSTGPYPAPRHRQLAGPEPTASKSETRTRRGGRERGAGGQSLLGHTGERSHPSPSVCPPCWNVPETCWPCPALCLYATESSAIPEPSCRSWLPASPCWFTVLFCQRLREGDFCCWDRFKCLNPNNLMLQTWKLSPTPVPKGRKLGGDHQAVSLP